MHEETPESPSASTPAWESVEVFARMPVQRFIQALLEEEVTARLSRTRSPRRAAVDAPAGGAGARGAGREPDLGPRSSATVPEGARVPVVPRPTHVVAFPGTAAG